jgi:hypothetical protein
MAPIEGANPGGRPASGRNRMTLALEAMLEARAEEILGVVIQRPRVPAQRACDELGPPAPTSPRLRGEVDRRPLAAVLDVQERRREASPMRSATGEGLFQRARRVESPPHPDRFAIRPLPASGERCPAARVFFTCDSLPWTPALRSAHARLSGERANNDLQ